MINKNQGMRNQNMKDMIVIKIDKKEKEDKRDILTNTITNMIKEVIAKNREENIIIKEMVKIDTKNKNIEDLIVILREAEAERKKVEYNMIIE